MPYSQSIFIDTTAFLALINENDTNYRSASKFFRTWKETLPEYKNLITSDYVFSEAVSKIRFRIGPKEAIDFGLNLRESRLIEIIYTSKEIFDSAWHIFHKIEEKNVSAGYGGLQPDYHPKEPGFHPKLSFIDSVTLACINYYKIPALFAFDEHLRLLAENEDFKKFTGLHDRPLLVYPSKKP